MATDCVFGRNPGEKSGERVRSPDRSIPLLGRSSDKARRDTSQNILDESQHDLAAASRVTRPPGPAKRKVAPEAGFD